MYEILVYQGGLLCVVGQASIVYMVGTPSSCVYCTTLCILKINSSQAVCFYRLFDFVARCDMVRG